MLKRSERDERALYLGIAKIFVIEGVRGDPEAWVFGGPRLRRNREVKVVVLDEGHLAIRPRVSGS
jgi:hypothetical protein